MTDINMTEKQTRRVLESLVCAEMPDTRWLQKIRLESIGTTSNNEKFIQEHYPDKFSQPRICRLDEEKLRRVYELAIPLSFPHLDYPCSIDKKHYFGRWANSHAAMHLTTEKGLNELLKIFTEEGLTVRIKPAFSRIFDYKTYTNGAACVPHSWNVEHDDPGEMPFEHQFVTCDEVVVAYPYIYKHGQVIKECNHEIHKEDAHFKIRTTETVDFRSDATYTAQSGPKPEDYLQKMRNDRDKERVKDMNERSLINAQSMIIESSYVTILKIGQPVIVYDPKWIK